MPTEIKIHNQIYLSHEMKCNILKKKSQINITIPISIIIFRIGSQEGSKKESELKYF